MGPVGPNNRLEAMLSRIAQSAVYVHSFDIGSVPFQIGAGVICSNHRDEDAASGYIRLANGKAEAASSWTTEGYSVRVPDSVEAAASGRVVSVSVVARAAACARSRFALAYSTNEVGNSGWRWHDAGPEWSVFTIEYDVPVMKNGNGDFIGILPDTKGRPGTDLCCLSVSTTGGCEFPGDLFDHEWYADVYADLKLPRDLPRDVRFTKSIEHYLKYGRRQRRDPNPFFHAKWYAETFKLPADADPLVHYAQHEKSGQVSPNKWWQYIGGRTRPSAPPPPLASLLRHYPAGRKPNYIVGIFGSGRQYVGGLLQHSDPEIAYYLRGDLRHYYGAVPVIFTGHVTSIYESALCDHPSFGRTLLDRAAADLISLIFIYRHPLDSLLSNWAWIRRFLRHEAPTTGIAQAYKSEEDFHRDLDDNFDEFSLFCDGSADFARIVTGSEINWRFLSLREYIHETEVFIGGANVQSFRFEDFKADAAAEFKRLVSILAPDLPPEIGNPVAPRALSSRYRSARENVGAFRSFMDSLPTDITKRIMALGYSV
jgi:hypothetical protein